MTPWDAATRSRRGLHLAAPLIFCAALVAAPLAAPEGLANLRTARADDVPPVPPAPPVPPVPPPPEVPAVPPAPPVPTPPEVPAVPPAPPVPTPPEVPAVPPAPPVPEVPRIPPAPPVPEVPPIPSVPPVAPPEASVPDASRVPPPPAPTSAALPSTETPVASLDELLAAVEGEYITRRMIVRQIGPRQPDDDEFGYEKRVHGKVISRVVNRILVKAAERFGLEAKPELVDKTVEESSRKEVDDAKERAERAMPGSGAGITFAKLLADRGQSLEEYKKELANEILVQNYFGILVRGVPGKRPQFDPEPSPGDALRLYRRHPGAFDEKLGVRVGLFMLQPLDLLEDGKRDYDQAVAEAKSRMGSLLAQFVAGGRPAVVAKTFGVDPRGWSVTEPGTWYEKQEKPEVVRPFDAWAFDPARRPGDTTIIDGKGGVVLGIGLVERRASRAKTFDEVRPEILRMIRGVRLQRFQGYHTLELLRSASVEPRSLIDEIETGTRERLRRLDEDPVAKDIRMR